MRHREQAPWTLALRAAMGACVLAACATPLVEPVEERLDRETGTTLTRLASPVELLATAPRAHGADPFAWLAPLETNRAGERATWLWIALPGDSVATPTVHCGGLEAEPRGATLSPASLGLARSPYRPPAAWNRQFLMAIDAAWIDCLASGAALSVSVGAERFASDGSRRRDLARFAAWLAR